MSDNIVPGSDSQEELFTPQQALALNEVFWKWVIEEMNARAISILATYISSELERQASDPDRQLETFVTPWEFSVKLEWGVDELESAIIEVAMGEKPWCWPARSYQRWSEMYDSEDPRVRVFLQDDNIVKIFNLTIDRFRKIGWKINDFQSIEGGYPDSITLWTK